MQNKITFRIFVYLKNTDLHALTAETTIKEILNFQKLAGLKRYQLWEIEFDTTDLTVAQEQLSKILNTTYYLINPNKEAYVLHNLKKKPLDSAKTLFGVLVNNENLQKPGLKEKILRKTGIKISKIKKYLLWELLVEHQEASQEELKIELTEKVIKASSLEKGLLINPLFEDYQFVDLAEYYDFS